MVKKYLLTRSGCTYKKSIVKKVLEEQFGGIGVLRYCFLQTHTNLFECILDEREDP